LLDPSVAQFVFNRRFYPRSLFGDRAGEFDERLKARSSGPRQPGVEQRDRLLEWDPVDLAELLGEQVGTVEALVERLDARELERLSMAICFSPTTARKFPTGGHRISPLVATRSPHQGGRG
jgi:hypothetical protein